ncbi:MAG: peptidoglycan DD-metalloendopeptidase family protein [Candidatus Paceibacterota bacterium]|jgi:murein DD-endopeptidase MepM/ murein hydrolase activator NlpD
MFFTQTKTQEKKREKIIPFFVVFLFAVCFPVAVIGEDITDSVAVNMATSTTDSVAAETEEEIALRNKISQKNNELETLKSQIDTYQKQLDFTQKEAKTLQNTVKALDIDRQKMNTSIKLTQKQLEATSLSIEETDYEINDSESKMKMSTEAIGEVLRAMDQTDSRTLIETILSNKKLSDMLDESMELSKLRIEVDKHLKELQLYKETLEKEKTKSEKQKKKLGGYKAQLVDQKTVLDIAKKEKNDLLSLTRNRETDYQRILDANLARKEAFEKELFDYESQLTRQLDRKYIPAAGVKILSWPLENIFITQHFGRTKDSVRLYASGTHNGIDFRASRGTSVKSPAKGEIVATGNTDITCSKASYGKWVLIRHDNGLTTLFGHFDVIKVSAGQSVEVGDLIGYSGNTGYSTGPHLHMTVFASDGVQVGSFNSKSCAGKTFTMPLPTAQNAYLDPEDYLPDL